MKKLISFILITVLALSFMAISVNAQCSLSISPSKKEVLVGDTFTVTFSFSASAPVESADATIQFDSSKFQYVKTTGGLGNLMPNHQGKTIKISDYGSGATSKTYKITMTFKALAVGSGTFSVTSSDIGDANFESLGAPTGSTTVSVKEESKSNNANLSSLTVPSGCTLVPKFSKNVTSYTCTVPYSVTKFPMDWTTEDKDATTSVTALQTLKVGENSRTVTVTAPDGTKKAYTVKVIREKAPATPIPTVKPTGSVTPTATATPTVTPTATPTTAPIYVNIDDTQYTVASSITLILPENFKKENFTYNSVQIETAVLGNVRLVQLFNGSRDNLFVYDSAQQSFSPYRHVTTGQLGYTVLDIKPDISIELKEEHIVIADGEYIGWSSERFGEGYYLLNVVNKSGQNYYALYCKDDGSIQKLSLKLLETNNVVIATPTPAIVEPPEPTATSVTSVTPTDNVVPTPQSTEEIQENEEGNFFEKINPIYVGIAACIIILIAIIIIIVVLISGNKNNKPKRDWGFDEDNDSYNFIVEDVEKTKSLKDDEDNDFE